VICQAAVQILTHSNPSQFLLCIFFGGCCFIICTRRGFVPVLYLNTSIYFQKLTSIAQQQNNLHTACSAVSSCCCFISFRWQEEYNQYVPEKRMHNAVIYEPTMFYLWKFTQNEWQNLTQEAAQHSCCCFIVLLGWQE
jgi:hypothetical protein